MSCHSCPLRRCQGNRGCLCPSNPPPFIYSKTTDKNPTLQDVIPITKTEFKRRPPKYIGETAPHTEPITRIRTSPKKVNRDAHSPVKAITAKLPQSEPKLDLIIEKEKEQKDEKNEINSDKSKSADDATAKDDSKPESDNREMQC